MQNQTTSKRSIRHLPNEVSKIAEIYQFATGAVVFSLTKN